MKVIDIIDLKKYDINDAMKIRIFEHNGKYDGWEIEFRDGDKCR